MNNIVYLMTKQNYLHKYKIINKYLTMKNIYIKYQLTRNYMVIYILKYKFNKIFKDIIYNKILIKCQNSNKKGYK